MVLLKDILLQQCLIIIGKVLLFDYNFESLTGCIGT